MKISKEARIKHANSPNCASYEYPFEDQNINVAFIELKGRYPTEGSVLNQKVKELLFITYGEGHIVIEGTTHNLKKGDMFLIHPNQKYSLEGNLEAVISCNPAWSPNQHQHINEATLSNH